MIFEDFKSVLDNIRSIDAFVQQLGGLGINAIDSPISNDSYRIQKILFTEIYGEEGYEWIEWYLYEQPHFQEMIETKGDKKEYHAWDESGNPMDLSTDDKLWEMLEKEYAVGKRYHRITKVKTDKEESDD